MFSLRWERYILAVIVVVVDIAGTSARAPQRVIGGYDAGASEIPWQVSIRKSSGHHCGGAIIGKKHILTAGHCVYRQSVDALTVVAGTNTLQPGTGKTYCVQSFKIHDRYREPPTEDSLSDHDIAVITLKEEIVENDAQKIISLPSKEVPAGVVGVISGFGLISSAIDSPLGETLQKLEVLIVGRAECMALGYRTRPYEFCVDNPYTFGLGSGDSGSPLVYKKAVVGIASAGPIISGNGDPDIYTRVYYYKDFILSAMQDSSKQHPVRVTSPPRSTKLSGIGGPQQHPVHVTSPPRSTKLSGIYGPQQHPVRVPSPPRSPKLSSAGRRKQHTG